jgi:hypothetical protein
MIYVALFGFACGMFLLGTEAAGSEPELNRGMFSALVFTTTCNAILLVLALS